MIEVIDAWLRLAAERIHERAADLTALDQAVGDGDHGTNMDRGFAAIRALLDAGRPEGEEPRAVAGARLRTAGRTLISTVGGAAGPLYGTALMRAGGAVAESSPDGGAGPVLVAALDAAIGGIQQLGKAVPGEKTMLDALVPAAEAGRTAVAAGKDTAEVAVAMAEAAEAGAIATIPLLATKGRASYLGERSIGHQDPGATSAALLLRALADATAGASAASVSGSGSDAG
jgi:dihydroxyacetone kinase-like protein